MEMEQNPTLEFTSVITSKTKLPRQPATNTKQSIQGVFPLPGKADRPFIYDVTPISSGRSFASRLVTARQPQAPSAQPNGPFPFSDAQQPMADACFSCITTFKRSRSSPAEVQAVQSDQQRYASILSAKAPHEWPVCSLVEPDAVRDVLSHMGHGTFPLLDMYRVDMSEYNKSKPITDRRELIYYRPHKPIPPADTAAHVVSHAFEADRNGITMLVNHMGYGHNLGKAASLTYSFYVHTNVEDAVMDGEGWWLQEASWPRVSAGRCMMVCKIWSPEGKHVATGYQDGIILPEETDEDKSKL